MRKFGPLFILIISVYYISGCAHVPSFQVVNLCSQVGLEFRCADYDLNNVEFIGEWSDPLGDIEVNDRLQYSIVISQKEFLLKLRPDLIKIRKFKKQKNQTVKKPKLKSFKPRHPFDRVNEIYELKDNISPKGAQQ